MHHSPHIRIGIQMRHGRVSTRSESRLELAITQLPQIRIRPNAVRMHEEASVQAAHLER